MSLLHRLMAFNNIINKVKQHIKSVSSGALSNHTCKSEFILFLFFNIAYSLNVMVVIWPYVLYSYIVQTSLHGLCIVALFMSKRQPRAKILCIIDAFKGSSY